MKLTKNINRTEVACRCGCGQDSIDYAVIQAVQGACDYFAEKLGKSKVILHINSGNRCEKHNAKVGGGDKSQHLLGKAIDHYIEDVTIRELFNYYAKKYPHTFGKSPYYADGFVHLDSRDHSATW